MSENKKMDNKNKVDGRRKKDSFLDDFQWKPYDKEEEKRANRDIIKTLFGGILLFFVFATPGYIYNFQDDESQMIFPLMAFLLVLLVAIIFMLFPHYEKWYYLEGTVVNKYKIKPQRRNQTTTYVDVETDDGKVLEHVLCHYPEWNEVEVHKSRVKVCRTADLEPRVNVVLSIGEE